MNMESVRTPNPLLLDVVLDKVFELLDLPNLLNCRLVCKLWRDNAGLKTTIKKKSVVSLRGIFLHTSTTKKNICNYFQHDDIIYTRYYFEHISYQNPLVSKVFEVMGPTISILQLHLDLNQLKINQFRELIYERVPNLEDLIIYKLSHEEIYYKQIFPDLPDHSKHPKHLNLKRLELQETRSPIIAFMTEFLRTLPNLREITLKTDVCSDWTEQAEMWRQNSAIAKSVIEGLYNSESFRTLKVFRCGKLLTHHIQALLELSERGMALEILELHVPLKETEELFTQFLSTLSKSLKELVLFEQRLRFTTMSGLGLLSSKQDCTLVLPDKMEQLELLQLSKNYKSWMVPMKPIDYARQTPKLKALTLLGKDGFGCTYDYFGNPSKSPCMVKSLVSHDQVLDPKIADMLHQTFPHLTKLTIRYPSPQFLTALWSSCTQIQDLSLYLRDSIDFSYMDDVMTGLDARIIGYYLSTVSKSYGHLKRLKALGNQQKVTCSIVNLADLRSLKIIVNHNENDERQVLSDATVEFALCRMKQLRLLELYTSHWTLGMTSCSFFSQVCCERLKKDLELTVIRFSPGDGQDHAAELDYAYNVDEADQ